MNIQQAKSIPLYKLIEYLGGRFSRKVNHDIWFYSPLRPDEKTASFKLNEKQNTWYDFGHSGWNSNGGDIIALWCEFYKLDKTTGIKDALKGIAQLNFATNFSLQNNYKSDAQNEGSLPRWKILKTHKSIFYPQLKDELARRKISIKTASQYLTQVYIQDALHTEKKLNGFGFANDQGGVEFSVPNLSSGKSFKSSTIPKGITTIKGVKDDELSVFEGFWDFLSWLEINKLDMLPHNCIVLNSNSFIREAAKSITASHTVKFVSLYLDNDESGFQATNNLCLLLEDLNIVVGDKRNCFEDFKDLNEFLIKSHTVTQENIYSKISYRRKL